MTVKSGIELQTHMHKKKKLLEIFRVAWDTQN
jgi:hypothetical protein